MFKEFSDLLINNFFDYSSAIYYQDNKERLKKERSLLKILKSFSRTKRDQSGMISISADPTIIYRS